MKKIFAVIALLATVSLQVWSAVGTVFADGNYTYSITSDATSSSYGAVKCTGLSQAGLSQTNLTIPYIVSNGGYSYYVESVAENAFENNTKLTAVTITYGIKYIRSNAFKGCTNIVAVRLPSSITRIESYCFGGCDKIQKVYYSGVGGAALYTFGSAFTTSTTRTLYVTWGTDRTQIRNRGAFEASRFPTIINSSDAYDYFMSDGTLFIVTKPSSTTSTPHECTIVGFKIASSVSNGEYYPSYQIKPYGQDRFFKYTAVADSAFLGNSSINTINMSRATGITTYGRRSMASCPNLTSVTLASGTLEIEALSNNKKLTSVTLDGVRSIGGLAFLNCSAIKTLNIPASVTSIVTTSFVNGCTALSQILVASGNSTFSSDNNSLYNKNKTWLYRVPEGYVYSNKAFPATLKSIRYGAFYNVKSVRTLALPYGIESAEEIAFQGCTNLKSVYIPATFKKFGDKVFAGCTSLNDLYVNMPVPFRLFKGNEFVDAANPNLYVPRGLEQTYKDADWTNFLSYNKDYMVARDTYIDNIDYTITSNNAEVINGTQYDGRCKIVRSGSLPDITGEKAIPAHITINGKKYAVTCIDNYAFYNSNLASVTGCQLVDTVAQWAFARTAIPSITLPKVSYIEQLAFYGCSSLTSAKWGNSLKTIGLYAFNGAPLAHDIVFPVGIQQVEPAFSGAKSKRILLPSTFPETNVNLFAGMSSLEEIIVNSNVFGTGYSFNFNDVPATCKVLVPVGYKDKAKAHANWSRFGNNIEEGAFDFCVSASNDMNSKYTLTVTSTAPVTINGVTYDGEAQYVYNKYIKSSSTFVSDKFETDKMTLGEKRYYVTSIGDSCFAHSNVATFDFSRMPGLKSIGRKAFYGSELTSADFGSLNIKLGDHAFTNATSLIEIVVRNNCTWSNKFFGNNAPSFNFFVPNIVVNQWVNNSTLRNYPYNNNETCAERVAPCFTCSPHTTTFDLGAIVPLDFSGAPYKAYVINEPANPVTGIIPTEQYGNCWAGRGVILTDLTPNTFYKVKRLLGKHTTSTPYLQPAYTTTSLGDIANSYYWNDDLNKFVKASAYKTVQSGRTFLVMPGGAPEYQLDIFAPATIAGDVNGDGAVDLNDMNIIINIMLGKTATATYPAADVDGNESVDLTDMNAIINIILGK